MQVASHQHPFCKNPLAYLAVAFACGILATNAIDIGLGLVLLISAAAFSVVIILVLKETLLNWATLLVILTTFFLGASFGLVEKREGSANRVKNLLDNGAIATGDSVELIGVVDGPPDSAPSGLHLTLRVESLRAKSLSQKAGGVVSLFFPFATTHAADVDLLALKYGARLRVLTGLKRTDSFRNPGVSSLTEYLERKGYDASGVVKSSAYVERLDDARVFLPLTWLYEWRQKVERQINAHFSVETAGVLNAALLGNRYGLSHSTAERFRSGGTFHVLVISGLHISFIGALTLMLARRITQRKILQFASATILLWGYTLAVGAQASVVRAAFMFTFVAFAPLVARSAASINALAASALFLLAQHPHDLFDPSFQLTFLSVAAIVVVAWPLLERFKSIGTWTLTSSTPYPPEVSPTLRCFAEILFWDERRWQRQLRETNYHHRLFKSPIAIVLNHYRLQPLLRSIFTAVVVSLSVQLVLLPVLVVYFHRLSFASIFLNVGVSILMALVSLVAMAALLVAQISPHAATPLIHCANLLDWLMVHSVDPFAALGIASVRLPQYSGVRASVYVLYYLPLLFIATLAQRWTPLTLGNTNIFLRRSHVLAIVASQALLVLVITFHPFCAPPGDGRLRMDFLDVGQGDAALVTFPNGSTLLIDGGGRPAFAANNPSTVDDQGFEPDSRPIGDAVVSEYLWHRGFDSVDYVLATHADADHIDGLNNVVENFHVRAAIVGRTPASDPEYARFAQTMKTESVPINQLGIGDTMQFGDVNATVLWPGPTLDNEAPSANNDSIVLRIKFGERSFLFTGDLESAGEAAVIRGEEYLHADVVKVGHHGSKTSSTAMFVNAVHPAFAIISVGQRSMFGHPNKEVVERWRMTGATVLTTGNCGTITVSTNGNDLHLETFVPCQDKL